MTRRLTPWRRQAGALCGLFGVAVLIGPRLVEGGLAAGGAPAELAIIGCGDQLRGFASLFGRRFRRLGVSPIATATGQVTASSLMLAPIVADGRPAVGPAAARPPHGRRARRPRRGGPRPPWRTASYLVVLAGGGAINVVLVTLLAPMTAILLGAAALDERLAGRGFLGLGPDRGQPRLHRRPPAAGGASALPHRRVAPEAGAAAELPIRRGAR